MKNTFRLFLLIFLIINIPFFSCKKKYSPPKPINIEYKIVPMNNSFVKAWYNVQSAILVPVFLLSSEIPADGSMKTTIYSKPFLAQISTEVNNQTNSNIIYDLIILVDGQIKKTVHAIAPAMTASSFATAEFTVQ